MGVSLNAEIEHRIREKVASGLYASADEVLLDALQLLEDRDRLRAIKLEELRKEIAIGIEQADRGEVAPLDMEAIRSKVADRIRERSAGS